MKRITFTPIKKLIIALVVWFGIMWSWVFFTDLLDLAGSKSQGLILAVIISAVLVAMSVFIIERAIRVVSYIFKRFSSLSALLLSLAVFSLADFLVSWLTALFWIGPHGRFDSILPLTSPTLLVVNTPLSFASRFIGFYGLAGFAWLTIFLLITKRFRLAGVSLSLISVLALFGWTFYKTPNGSSFTAVVISESLSERVAPIEVAEKNAKLTVFPEYGLDKVSNEKLSERIKIDPTSTQKYFFLGSEEIVPQDKVGHFNQLLYGNTVDGYTYKQNKYRLIPGGEDLPYFLRTGLRATNQKGTLDYFSAAKGTLQGPTQLKPFVIDSSTTVGSAVCSSIVAPMDYRYFAKEGATLFTNSASLTIFQGSPVFAFQQKSLAKFMATANSRYFLQSANKARAFILDNNGKTLAEGNGQKIISHKVTNNTTKTPYTIVGEWLVYVGVVVSGALAAYVLLPKLKKAYTKKKSPKLKSHKK